MLHLMLLTNYKKYTENINLKKYKVTHLCKLHTLLLESEPLIFPLAIEIKCTLLETMW